MEFIDKYIGKKKIIKSELIRRTTLLGKPVHNITFEDKLQKEYPLEVLERIVTDEPIEWDQVTEKTLNPVVEKILAIMTEAEVTVDEAKYILQSKAFMSLEVNKKKADKVLWGKEEYQVTLMDVDQQLRKNVGKKENNKSGDVA